MDIELPSRRSKRVPKFDAAISERIIAAEETLQLAVESARAKGVTRVGEITGLDRLGIPVYSAIVPKSDDAISVYNGKGLRTIDSKVSALMEAIERQTVLSANPRIVESSYQRLKREKVAVANPRTFNHELSGGYREEQSYWWIEGYDLIAEEPVMVPAGLAGYGLRYMGECSPYMANSTNGLASGNCFEEAVCHGLCELLERDAWSLAELKSRWIPRARREIVFGKQLASLGADDPNACPRIDLQNASEPFTTLLGKFHKAGLSPVVRDITSDFKVPCVLAAVSDDSIPGFPQAHAGTGAHPNFRIAAIRALTELAQSRAVDIQGIREDILETRAEASPFDGHMLRLEKIEADRWVLQQAGHWRPFGDMTSTDNEDIAEDIRLILSRLAANGIERAIVVDFSEPGPFSVVRVIVPGLESWAVERGPVGERAAAFWRAHF